MVWVTANACRVGGRARPLVRRPATRYPLARPANLHPTLNTSGPLHALNPVRVRYILEHCGRTREGPHPSPPNPGDGARKDGVRPVKGLSTKSLHGMRILDVGCGGGLLSEALAR